MPDELTCRKRESSSTPHGCEERPPRQIARLVLPAFVLTFVLARVLVLLIMSRLIPDWYLYIHGTHVHHLNFGIFLLAGAGGYLLLARPTGRPLSLTAITYGIGLALTFDEFGMWLHLGGGYWQRASFDAIVLITALLGLIAAAPSLKRFRPRHWATAAAVVVALLAFGLLLANTLGYASRTWGPKLQKLEATAPP